MTPTQREILRRIARGATTFVPDRADPEAIAAFRELLGELRALERSGYFQLKIRSGGIHGAHGPRKASIARLTELGERAIAELRRDTLA